MKIFSSIGHVVASFFLGVYKSLSGKSTASASAAVQIGAAAGQLLDIADPQAAALVNAAVTGYGDIVQAVKATGAKLTAGSTVTIKVSDALAAASETIWPEVEKIIAAFEGVTGASPAAGAAK